jgi:hypothetical protein
MIKGQLQETIQSFIEMEEYMKGRSLMMECEIFLFPTGDSSDDF